MLFCVFLFSDIPESTTIDELKKFMEDAGDVLYADIRDGKGIVEYSNNEDMRYAVKKITATELKTASVSKTKDLYPYIPLLCASKQVMIKSNIVLSGGETSNANYVDICS